MYEYLLFCLFDSLYAPNICQFHMLLEEIDVKNFVFTRSEGVAGP